MADTDSESTENEATSQNEDTNHESETDEDEVDEVLDLEEVSGIGVETAGERRERILDDAATLGSGSVLDEDAEPEIIHNNRITPNASRRSHARRLPTVPPAPRLRLPPIHLRCVKISSFVSANSNATQTIQVFPASMILPPECLVLITHYEVKYPLHFQLVNPVNSKSTVCGITMFTADTGTCSIPDWIMDNLALKDGDLVSLICKPLVQGNYAKLEPQSVDFLQMLDPKETLEKALSKFPCISTGDVFPVYSAEKTYLLKVLETKPESSISITNSDLTVEFAPPVGYVDPNNNEMTNSGPFPGIGQRLDGQDISASDSKPMQTQKNQRGVPNWEFEVGEITFNRKPKPDIPTTNEEKTPFEPFSGTGFSAGGNASGSHSKNSRPNSERDASEATPNKVPRTENALDVSESTLDDNNDAEDEDYSDSDTEEEDPNDPDYRDSASEKEEEDDDPNDPDYSENMVID